jgi:hypothetical protein
MSSWISNGLFLIIMGSIYALTKTQPSPVGMAISGIVLLIIGVIDEVVTK